MCHSATDELSLPISDLVLFVSPYRRRVEARRRIYSRPSPLETAILRKSKLKKGELRLSFQTEIEPHEHPVVEPHVLHFRQVPLRTSVKLPHSPQL